MVARKSCFALAVLLVFLPLASAVQSYSHGLGDVRRIETSDYDNDGNMEGIVATKAGLQWFEDDFSTVTDLASSEGWQIGVWSDYDDDGAEEICAQRDHNSNDNEDFFAWQPSGSEDNSFTTPRYTGIMVAGETDTGDAGKECVFMEHSNGDGLRFYGPGKGVGHGGFSQGLIYDWNDDGDTEFVHLPGEVHDSFHFLDDTGSIQKSESAGKNAYSASVAADFDGDGSEELAAVDQGPMEWDYGSHSKEDWITFIQDNEAVDWENTYSGFTYPPKAVDFNGDGDSTLVIFNDNSNWMKKIDETDGSVKDTVSLPISPEAVATNGEELAIANSAGEIRIIDSTGTVTDSFSGGSVTGLGPLTAIHMDSEYVYWGGTSSVFRAEIGNEPPDSPSNPYPSDGSITRTLTTTISAKYNDPDGDSGTLTFYDAASGSKIGSCSVSDGNRCGVSWDHDHGSNDWYAVAEDSNGASTQGPDWTLIHNQKPSVDSLDSPPDGATVYGTTAELKATVSDPDDDNLAVTFYDNQTVDKIGSKTVSGTAGGTTATVDWSGLTRGDNYEWHVVASDPWESDQVDKDSGFYVNQLPTASDPVPEDDALVEESPVNLQITSSDPEGSDVTVYFINASDGTIIGKSGTDSSDEASAEWHELDIGESYEWFVNASDGKENLTSKKWAFTRAVSSEFRHTASIDYSYTHVITSPGNPEYLFFRVRNRVDESKTLNTSLSGVNAEFLGGGWYQVYTLQGESEKRFQVRVEPESTGRYTLDIKTENQELGLMTNESIPVYSRETSPGSPTRDVPGIGILQLLAITIVSTVLVSVSL